MSSRQMHVMANRWETTAWSRDASIDRGRCMSIALSIVVGLAVFGIWNGSLVAQDSTGQNPDSQAEELPGSINKNWDEVFTTRQGWTGGDGGGTVNLGNDRILWMFADSFIGGVAEGKHSPGSHMINNVFAVQKLNDRSKPLLEEFEFAWGPAGLDGKPTAWQVPDPEIMSRARKLDDNKKPHGWFWPAGGGCVVELDGKQRLYVFFFHIGSNGKKGVWGFENIGGAMAVVDNPEQPIGEWNVRQLDLPFTRDALQALEQTKTSETAQATPLLETNWGLSCIVNKDIGNTDGSGFVYVYGDQHRQYKNRQLILARVKPEHIEDFAKWEFFSAVGWVDDVDRVEPIADEIGAEFSIERVEFEGRTRFVMVHSQPMLGTRIFVRTSDAPEGPWSKPLAVYEVTDVKKSENYFTYAARGHAMVSPEGRLLITYIVNSNDFWEMAGDASIYRPRCISVPMSVVFGHE